MAKILSVIFASHDSFINVCVSVSRNLNLSKSKLVIPITSLSQISANQLSQYTANHPYKLLSTTESFDYLSTYDNNLVICCVGIKIRHQLFKHFHRIIDRRKRPLVVTCFAGVIFGDEKTLLSNTCADLVLLNCKADLFAYQLLGRKFQFVTDNAMVFGMPQLLGTTQRTISTIKTVCFFEQVIAPATFTERSQLLRELVAYAECFPVREVLIKLRCRPDERTVHKQIWHLEKLERKLRLGFPGNLQFTYEPVPSLLDRIDLCLTISSTVALEALARNIPVGIINDFGIRTDIHTIHFINSGCMVSFADLRNDRIPVADETWVKSQVKIPDPAELNRKVAELLKQRERGCLPVRSVVELPTGKNLNTRARFRKKLKKFFDEPLIFFCDSRYRVLSLPAKWLFRMFLNRKIKSWGHINNG